jgi:hypothetical protein
MWGAMGHTEHATVYTDPGAPASLVCVSARPSKQNGSTKTCVSDYPSGALQEGWGRGGGGAVTPPLAHLQPRFTTIQPSQSVNP